MYEREKEEKSVDFNSVRSAKQWGTQKCVYVDIKEGELCENYTRVYEREKEEKSVDFNSVKSANSWLCTVGFKSELRGDAND